jgi:hypothetical protein
MPPSQGIGDLTAAHPDWRGAALAHAAGWSWVDPDVVEAGKYMGAPIRGDHRIRQARTTLRGDAMTARDRLQRQRDALAALTAPAADAWVATASPDGAPHLVPLSLAWIDDRAVVAVDDASRTARNIVASGVARLGVGPTRDVVMIDVRFEAALPVLAHAARRTAELYAAQADWDPRTVGGSYVYLVLRPHRMQAWREVDEMPGRTLMRDGNWLI